MSEYYEGLNEKLLTAIPPVSKVLELGCASGRLGQQYKILNPSAQWIGVDANEDALAIARTRLDQTYKLDLDSDDISVVGDGFEIIVIGDLLEHVKDPESLLRKLKPLCREFARLICCVPNMSHISVLERMIAGDITYDTMGLLDTTHLRFFSPSSIVKTFMDAGWLPNLTDYYTSSPKNQKFADLIIAAGEALDIPPATTIRNFSLYQLIIECVPSKEIILPALVPTTGKRLSIIVPTNNDQQLSLNIQKSPGLKEIDAEVILCKDVPNAATAFSLGVAKASSKWVIFCHQDVYFPRGSGIALCKHLETIPAEQAPNTLIGFAGMGLDANNRSYKSGLVIDRLSRFDFPPTDNAISLDELAIVLSKNTQHKIDPTLGWHLWATDLCLNCLGPGNPLLAQIVRIPVFHNSYNDGKLSESFHNSANILAAKHPNYPIIPTLCGNIESKSVEKVLDSET